MLEPLVKPGKPIKPPVQVPVSPRAAYPDAIHQHAPREAQRTQRSEIETAYSDSFASSQTAHEVPKGSTSGTPRSYR